MTPYEARIQSLFERHPSVQSRGFSPDAYKPGLDAMRVYDARLGHPHRAYRTIHVAGTNGKGSVCSMLAASLAGIGHKVGLYTSPHIVDFRERMKIVDKRGFSLIPPEDVMRFLDSYDEPGLSFFEVTTGMALWWFAQMGVDVAVVEVGLGGRLDSTNIITPQLTVVTSIGLDHCALLGNTRVKIAAEKAGIFKKGVPALVWGHDDETDPVFGGMTDDLHFAEPHTPPARMDLKGEYEALNLDTALSALELLGEKPCLEAIGRTAELTGFRGRWEQVYLSPDIICDIGHNPAALKLNFRQLEQTGRALRIVYGLMADKDLDGIAPHMPSGADYYLCAPRTARAMDAGVLHARLAALRPDLRIVMHGTVGEALACALRDATEETLIYAGGSTYVVSETMDFVKSL